MVQEITVLVVPPGYDGNDMGDPRVDEVEVDPTIEESYLDSRIVSDEGSSAVDRALVNRERKELIADAILTYQEESSKEAPDVQVQLDSLEKAVSYMWDVVSGEDVGSESQRSADAETDGSTSA
ncbi:hypothetical protein M1M41_gp092 [Halorubrum sodomense tailed virus 4]|uniref:Uncharacterized protein n=1 Tax=Halorubrum sodomense tailed virus 4 TaxID=2878013 RepID=A0AAE8XV56_9CAUD|nr:hypothetical protein M1M41_gp092 [Halorubrum sodomense tailed virus 4]UBF19741.1 hypothetical protein HRTV-18_gp32 [Halorubrum virus HRTV-18]UBF19864.1 hypothetical protein HRTV-20_gp32 [Halorubrum virus HRTV-20]UBF20239.1 hypothetical protein HSTV-4_gp32 [Halorubrum sodomense tailed virus 4]UFK26332.1 hypothetical protein [Hardygib1 virus]